jgi:hypothetical protein
MPLRVAYSPGSPVIWHGMARVMKVLGTPTPILTSDLGTSTNTVALTTIPANFTIAAIAMDIPKMDNGTGLTLSLGTASAPALILNASTAGQTGAVGVPPVAGARGTYFANQTDLILTVNTAATTPVAGTVVIFVYGYIDP